MKTNCRDCCYPGVVDSKACGCCEGIERLTPLSRANRPGLSQLSYRIGTHASFLETMKAVLSSSKYPELEGLTTRDAEDPSIALLDGWATVADVLTFYQERIANEGYLRTATERRSILELARLVGYKLRPGVASSVFLAYTIDENTKEKTTILAGNRVQSVPGSDELPQSFETSEDLKARAKWNNLKPRMTQPQTIDSINNGLRIYLKGINTNLKLNEPLLIGVGNDTPIFYRIKEVKADASADRTLVILQNTTSKASESLLTGEEDPEVRLIKDLTLSSSLQPFNTFQIRRKFDDQFKQKAGTGYQTVSSFAPILRDTLVTAAANATFIAAESELKVYALRAKASLFGHNATQRTRIKDGEIEIIGDWPIIEKVLVPPRRFIKIGHEEENIIYLDSRYDNILKGDWIVIETPDTERLTKKRRIIVQVKDIDTSLFRSKYGITAPTTQIHLDNNTKWIEMLDANSELKEPSSPEFDDFNAVRGTTVYAQPEELELAEEPIKAPVCGGTDELLELDDFYEGLESGRWLIVSGEREIEGTSGVKFSELAMLASVTHDVDRTNEKKPKDNEKIHTFIKLAENLKFCFKRDTVTIHGNVVKATHGETRKEVFGSGDGSKALQSFELKQVPLTHTSASNPTGIDSTLSVFVNDVKWHETDSLVGLHPNDRNFVTKTNDDSKTSVIFGNGREGTRLPTGIENIRAEYRNGIGKGGNVKAEQISLLATKPLGVKEVINPLRASGGADRENRDQARKSVPLAVMALDRLVSVRDYKDFARLYAGIGKAEAVEISNGRQQLVHVTIAGADDIPIDETSDLFINLRQALHDFGDPYQPIQLAVRELMFIVISTNVQIQSDYQWEPVVVNLRAALLDAFSFERRELGQDVMLSEVISVMQAVPGVEHVDVDTFGGIPEKIAEEDGNRRLLTPDEVSETVTFLITDNIKRSESSVNQRLSVNLADFEKGVIRPAQLAFLTPDVPDTLILNQIK